MKKCLHSGIHRTLYRDVGIFGMFYRPCERCGEWLPMGPSTDTPETAIGLRAAELAVATEADFTQCEWMGWNGDETYSTTAGSYHTIDKLPTHNLREWHAGYLARCISEHKETP